MKVVAFIPVKGTSSRIENKNIKLLDGKPLFLHSLEKLLECDFIDDVYIDTESDVIIDLCEYHDCKILKRDSKLANNKTDGNKLFFNEIKNVDSEIYIQYLCTSPFIEIDTIKKGVDMVKSGKYDSSVLVKKDKMYIWDNNGPKYDKENIPNSIDLEDTITETMGLYITNRNALDTKMRIGETPFLLEATPTESIDLNYECDFDLAQLIASGKREKERKLLNNIKTHLNSSMLSDILDEMGIDGVIKKHKLNLSPLKVLGRAKTLEIRELEEGEDYRGIYDALKTYESIIPNDIIFVKNNIEECAYFGELNANLAIRSGASGAIISGYTRDSNEVKNLGFPVFSKGFTCKDVKKRGTVESFNKKIIVDGVAIYPNDLIFGDVDGIIVMPKIYEKEILKRAFEIVKCEKNILIDICDGVDISEIISKNGFF
jgi:regulator of RNase E activity RraA/CMP-N-acetylneuraminic acid synthetase